MHATGSRRPHLARGRARRFAVLLLAAASLLPAAPASADVGFADGSFSGTSAPTGMKPQSKLWVADGIWWGSMFNSFTQRFEIYRRDAASERWTTTGTVVDGRRNVWADAKWDGTHLFIVSAGASSTSTLDAVKLERFSYNSSAKTWSLDAGFPVTIDPTGTEAAVLDEDSTGRIWITYTQEQKVWVTHSTTSTASFVTPFVPPLDGAANLTADDMSALVAYDGRIGVMWSNENDWAMYFGIHVDGDGDSSWTAKPAIQQSEWADDHMNLKAIAGDPSGNKVFAATKTSLNGANDPLLVLNAFNGTTWTRTVYGTVSDQHTRPLVLIDQQHRQLYMFAAAPCCSGGIVYYKQTTLDSPAFQPGLGTPFIASAAHPTINNVSSTKQPLDGSTGLVAIAGDDGTKTYLHNTIDLSRADTTPPETTIDSGPSGTVNNPDARFTFSSSEAGSTFQCRLDGAAFTACSSPAVYTSLSDGAHGLQVRAVDVAGNTDATPASRSWTIENTGTVVNVTAAADAWVDQARPTRNLGADISLSTDKSSNGTADTHSYFRFSVAGTHRIVSAKLRAWVINGSTNGPQILRTSSTWSENGITWANKPAAVGGVLDDKGNVPKNAWVEYDVTPAVTGNGDYGFVTIPASTDGTDVNSREVATRAPVLELRVDPPPDTTIVSGPASVTNATSATFAFTSPEPSATFQCSVDGGTYANCTSPTTYSGLTDGSHSFNVRATDSNAQTDPSPAVANWTVDTAAPAPPTLTLSAASDTGASSSDGVTADTSPTFTGTAEAGSLVTLRANGTQLGTALTNGAGYWSMTTEDLTEGSHTVTATAGDQAGNDSGASPGLLLVIDTTPPSVPVIIDPAADLATQDRDLAVGGTATAGVEVRVLDATSTAATTKADGAGGWSATLTDLPDGVHPIAAVTADAAGNTSDASPTRTVTVDNLAPDTTITDAPPDPAARTTASFSFSSTQSGSTFECSLDDAPVATCASPQSYDDLAGGAHTFAVRAVDAAGNVDATPATYSWSVNSALPHRPVISSPASDSFASSSTVTVSGTADPAVTVEVFDGPTPLGSTPSADDGTWSLSLAGLTDGTYSFAARATNDAGSSALSSPAVTVTVDTARPDTSIDSGPMEATGSTSAAFGFSSSETGGTFECSLDGAPFTACTAPGTATGLSDGIHTFEVRAIDRAGNVDATPASRAWTVDTVAPDTSITSGPAGVVAASSAQFAFTSTETGSTFQCRLDQGSYAACTSPKEYSGLNAGTHTVDVRATDTAGNTDSTPASRTWEVQQVVLSDGFETSIVPTGFASPWMRAVGADGTAVVQTDTVKTGTQAARLAETANTGSFATLRYDLPFPHGDVTVDDWIRIEAEGPSGGNVPVLRLFDSAGSRQLSFYRQNVNSDRLYVNWGGTAFSTTGRLPLGTWAHFVVHVTTGAAGGGRVDVSMNGTSIYSTTVASVGSGLLTVQLGNETRKQPFQLVADDVTVSLQ